MAFMVAGTCLPISQMKNLRFSEFNWLAKGCVANRKALLGPGFSKIPNSCHGATEDTMTLPLSNFALLSSSVKIWDGLWEDQIIQSDLKETWRSESMFSIRFPQHKHPAHPRRAAGSSSVTGICYSPCLLEWNQHALLGLLSPELSIYFIPEGCIIWLLISQESGNKEVHSVKPWAEEESRGSFI